MEKTKDTPPPILYHYTSIETLFKILEEVKKPTDTITMWASHASFMNDPREMEHLFIIAEKEDQELELEKTIQEMVYGEPFVFSLSEHKNSLPMWRMYGDSGGGVAIGFSSAVFESMSMKEWQLLQCKYPTSNEIRTLPEYEDLWQLLSKFKIDPEKLTGNREFDALITFFERIAEKYELDESGNRKVYETNEDEIKKFIGYCAKIKHSDYKYENEWRLFRHIHRSKLKDHIKYKEQTYFPYIELPISLDSIQRITIGPTADARRVKRLLQILLRSKENPFCAANIQTSETPYTIE